MNTADIAYYVAAFCRYGRSIEWMRKAGLSDADIKAIVAGVDRYKREAQKHGEKVVLDSPRPAENESDDTPPPFSPRSF